MKLEGQWWSRKRGSGLVGSEVGSKGQREVKNYLKDRLERKPEVEESVFVCCALDQSHGPSGPTSSFLSSFPVSR